MSRNIVKEPSTLVYTLLDTNALPFEDFSLLVRSLHTWMVESITPNPQSNNVHVKLSYQASVVNAYAKLGDLQNIVTITKLSSFIKDDEISRLEELRRRFNIGSGDTTEQPIIQRTSQPRQRKTAGPGRVYQRHTPYAKKDSAPKGYTTQQPFEEETIPTQYTPHTDT